MTRRRAPVLYRHRARHDNVHRHAASSNTILLLASSRRGNVSVGVLTSNQYHPWHHAYTPATKHSCICVRSVRTPRDATRANSLSGVTARHDASSAYNPGPPNFSSSSHPEKTTSNARKLSGRGQNRIPADQEPTGRRNGGNRARRDGMFSRPFMRARLESQACLIGASDQQ